jgi:hypothetical protein
MGKKSKDKENKGRKKDLFPQLRNIPRPPKNI